MKGYLGVARNSIQANMIYRAHFFFTLAGNIFIIIFLYYFWQAIYGGADQIKGLSFNDAFITVALSRTIWIIFFLQVDWQMSFSIIQGTVIQILIKPVDYQLYLLAGKIGLLLFNIVIIALPSLLVLLFVFKVSLPVGPNILFFLIAIILSFFLTFIMEYIIGLLSFYTRSIWGVTATKNVLILVFSGAMVPLALFPAGLLRIVQYLPFRVMYDLPMRMLLTPDMPAADYIKGFGLQVFWIIVLGLASRLFYKKAIKVVTVAGG